MVKVGDRVKVNGIEAVVLNSYASGKYRNYVLSDGRTVLDLSDDCVVKGASQPGHGTRKKQSFDRETRLMRGNVDRQLDSGEEETDSDS